MANKKFSDLTAATTVAGGDIIAIETVAGNSRKVAASVAGVACGTAFPGTPSSGDRFYRTDRAIEYYYDGTRWLSVALYATTLPAVSATATANGSPIATNPFAGTYDIYVTNAVLSYIIVGTGSWTQVLATYNTSGVYTTIASHTVTNAAPGPAAAAIAVNQVVANATIPWMAQNLTENSGTSSISAGAAYQFRLVG